MSFSLENLRHLAKELLALATLELFPGTELIGGQIDELGFSYDFRFPDKIMSLFGQHELNHLEDKLLQLVIEKRPLKALEMMRENAVIYLEHGGHLQSAERAARCPENIVSLIQIGDFHDLCPALNFQSTKDVQAVKLLKFQEFGKDFLRVYGTAFESRDELKTFLKKYKKASKNDPLNIGVKEKYFEPAESGEWIWLPKAEALFWDLRQFWRQKHLKEDFSLLEFCPSSSLKETHKQILKKTSLKKVASFHQTVGDLATIRCQEGEQFEQLISSLQFIQQAFMIFGFEIAVNCGVNPPGLFKEAFKHLGIDFGQEARIKERDCITFNTFDGYGRSVTLSTLELDETNGMIHRSLCCSLKNWMALLIERGVKKLEFENQ